MDSLDEGYDYAVVYVNKETGKVGLKFRIKNHYFNEFQRTF